MAFHGQMKISISGSVSTSKNVLASIIVMVLKESVNLEKLTP